MTILNYNSPFISQAGESGLARLGLISRYSPSYVRKLGRESSEQGIKLLVRSFRRLRLFFCGLLTRPTAPRHAPQISEFPSNPKSAPRYDSHSNRKDLAVQHYAFKWSRLTQCALHYACFFSCPVFFFKICTFIVKLFTFCYTYFYLHPRARPVQRECRKCHTFTVNATE